MMRLMTTIRVMKKETLEIRKYVKAQNILFKDKDDLVDKIKVQDLFHDIYQKLLKKVQNLNI